MKNNFIFIVIAFTILLIDTGESQVLKSGFFRNTDIMTGVSYQSWTTEDDQKISEMVIPLSVVLPFSRSFALNISSNQAFAKLNSASKDLNGLTDTRVLASLVTLNDKLLLTLGVTAPTGKTRLEADQGAISSALAIYPFDFRVPSFGQGLSGSFSGVFAFEAGDFIFGGGAGFVYKKGFKPFQNSEVEYIPGHEISVNAGGETNLSRTSKITLDATYTLYGADKFDGTEVFKSGNKIIVDLRTLFKISKTDLMIYVKERTKGKNERGVGSLTAEENNSNGNQLELGSLSYSPLSESFGLRGAVDFKLYSKNDYDNNGATIFGFGGGFTAAASRTILFDVLVKYYLGSLENKSTSVSITGLEAGGTIRFRF